MAIHWGGRCLALVLVFGQGVTASRIHMAETIVSRMVDSTSQTADDHAIAAPMVQSQLSPAERKEDVVAEGASSELEHSAVIELRNSSERDGVAPQDTFAISPDAPTVLLEAEKVTANSTSMVTMIEEKVSQVLASNAAASSLWRSFSRSIKWIVLVVALAVFVCTGLVCCMGLKGVGGGNAKNWDKPTSNRNKYVSGGRIIYEWEQNEEWVVMYIKPPGSMSKNNIEVLLWSKNVQLGKKGKPPFLKEELFDLIDAEASTWGISREGELEIRLKKNDEEEWPCVILTHLRGSKRSQYLDPKTRTQSCRY